jgi:hypothetical protein
VSKTKQIAPELGAFIHIDEFARMVNRDRRTVSRWIHDRPPGAALPHIKLGREVHIPLQAAREWLAYKPTTTGRRR